MSTATGAPFLTISISSPPATRLRTSEKFRAASVALNLVMLRGYQINLIPRVGTPPGVKDEAVVRNAANPGYAGWAPPYSPLLSISSIR